MPSPVVEAFDAGDASRLSGGDGSGGDIAPAPSTAPDVEQTTASDGAEQSRGRDGLTAAEREAIREWAVNEGIEVKARGILKRDLIANYEAWSARQS
ncbi:Lsr2 family DNA-binding protein [Actinomycetospora aurantiaca]|uniref:Lsr2 family DNA-binding protein n=1 Tax=Actinomycetospora aurantiaca TaxID=3129233 RepID=UPI0040387CA6